MKKSKELLAIIFLLGFIIITSSFFFASLMRLHAQISIKILILCVFGFIALFFILIIFILVSELVNIQKHQLKILMYIRLISISAEKHRLYPEDTEQSINKLNEELKEEEEIRVGDKILREASLGFWKPFIYFFSVIVWLIIIGLLVLATIACTFLILENWNVINSFFI